MTQANFQNTPPERPQNNLVRIWDSITAANSAITEIGDRRRAQIIAGLAFILFITDTIGIFVAPSKTVLAAVSGVCLLSYLVSRTKYFQAGAFLFIAGFSVIPYVTIFTKNTNAPAILIFSFIPLSLILASAFLNKWMVLLLTGLDLAAIAYLMRTNQDVGATLGIIGATGILLSIVDYFRDNIETVRLKELKQANQELRSIQVNLEERVAGRTEELRRRSVQMEAASYVARIIADVRDPKTLLDNVIYHITDRFGFYHTGIFLVDASEQFVVLQAASSEGGKKMMAHGHRLEIGRQGIVGYAAYQRRPHIAQDVGTDAVYFNNPDLPQTHSEVALPLVTQNQLIGVLDIQSTERNAFSNEDVYTLQAMADQIALAINNARLINESQAAIQQYQALMGQKTSLSWKEWLGTQGKGYTYTPLGITPLESTGEAPARVERSAGERSIQVPIKLRGKQIGTISMQRKSAEAPWSDAEQEMADKIAVQVALAVENARLLEESQKRAAREQQVNDLSSRFSRSLDVDTLLQNAVRELQNIHQVSEVSVFIAPEQPTGKTGHKA